MASPPEVIRAFRIADQRHPILDGMGTFMLGSRWVSRGRRVIHASETYAASLLEMLVHCNIGRIPKTHNWIEITCPVKYGVAELRAAEISGWNALESTTARSHGDRWYEEKKDLILLVPSVVTAGVERNVLINQDHPGFPHVRATAPAAVQWDTRLFHVTVAESAKKSK
jgi:RES domain-containing protein